MYCGGETFSECDGGCHTIRGGDDDVPKLQARGALGNIRELRLSCPPFWPQFHVHLAGRLRVAQWEAVSSFSLHRRCS
jgi:hypothetical protein